MGMELNTIFHLTEKRLSIHNNAEYVTIYKSPEKTRSYKQLLLCNINKAEQEVVFEKDEIEANIANLFIFDYSKSYPVILLALT